MSVAIVCWGMLLVGAGWTGYGLIGSLARFREWRASGGEDDGEIVLGDGRLAVGQSVELDVNDSSLSRDLNGALRGSIVSIGRRYCEIAADYPPDRPGGTETARQSIELPAAGSPRSAGRFAAGVRVSLSVAAASEIYRFRTHIRDVFANANGLRLFVTRPAAMVRIQRRRHARAALSVPATFERIPETGALPSAKARSAAAIRHGTVRDLSAGGLRAQIGGALRLGEIDALLMSFRPESILRIGLPFPALPRNSLFARVLSCGRAVTSGGLTVQITCEFLPMPPWEQEIVVQHVFQFQRERSIAAKRKSHDDQSGFRQ